MNTKCLFGKTTSQKFFMDLKLISSVKVGSTLHAGSPTKAAIKTITSKSLVTFKYKPQVTVEDEVKRMLEMFKENRVKNPEDKVYHNGAYLKNKKEKNEVI